MSTITALKTGKRDDKKVNLFIDGKFAFSVEKEAAVKEGLKVGGQLEGERLEALMQTLQESRCLDAAYRYLAYRSRSEAELKERLLKRGFPLPHIERALNKLREQGLVNDSEFANFWAENRARFSPRSHAMMRSELRQKGVTPEVIHEAVNTVDESEAAYDAARSKLRGLHGLEYPEFRQRLGEFLRRRGFGYEIINRTVKKVWQEINLNNKEKE
jgi:regulatory protein